MQQLNFFINEDESSGHTDILRLPLQIPCQIRRILGAQQIQIPGLGDTQDIGATPILCAAFPGTLLLMRAVFFHAMAVFQGLLVDTPAVLHRGPVPCLDGEHNVRPFTTLLQRLGDSVQVLHLLYHQQDSAEHIYQNIPTFPELRSRIQEGLDPGGFTGSRSRRNDQRPAGVPGRQDIIGYSFPIFVIQTNLPVTADLLHVVHDHGTQSLDVKVILLYAAEVLIRATGCEPFFRGIWSFS
ncbi:hypothetical protein [Flavonifractor sp. An82]|uniref:hypothetical protein n=1 Tax=Flavonifractor sp. An82 TaxID=1965660 RepID=UPI0013A5FEE2|nr:hypothetical protein [Flavonifractor sp. An82]